MAPKNAFDESLPGQVRSVHRSRRAHLLSRAVSERLPDPFNRADQIRGIMRKANRDMFLSREHFALVEYEPHQFPAEASDLGFPVSAGEWPKKISTDLGNGQPLYLISYYSGSSDYVHYARYSQGLGCISLEVFND